MEKTEELTLKKSPKRLAINIPDQVHWRLKNKAHSLNMTISRYVLQAIQMRINREEGI